MLQLRKKSLKIKVLGLQISRFHITLIPLLSIILFSSCAKSLTDEGFPEYTQAFAEREYSDYNMALRYDRATNSPYWVYHVPEGYENTDLSFIQKQRFFRPIQVLRYKILANPSKKEQYEKEIQKIEQGYLQNCLSFLQDFYSDLYQKSQKDFTHQYKSHCCFDIQRALKNVYAQIHQGHKGYAWCVFGDNVKHDSTDLKFTHMGNSLYNHNWFKVKLDTNYVLLQLDGLEKKKIKIVKLVNRSLNFAVE